MKTDPTGKTLCLAVTTGAFLGASAAGWVTYLFQSVAGQEHTAIAIALSSTVVAAMFMYEVFARRDRAREILRRYRENLAKPSTTEWRPCVIESPYAGDTDEEVEHNLRYLRAAMNWCLHNGYAPFASHGIYTQPGVLRDEVHDERRLGIDAGKAVGKLLPVRLVFTDKGVTGGMQEVLDEPVGDQVVVPVRLGKAWEGKVPVRRWRGHNATPRPPADVAVEIDPLHQDMLRIIVDGVTIGAVVALMAEGIDATCFPVSLSEWEEFLSGGRFHALEAVTAQGNKVPLPDEACVLDAVLTVVNSAASIDTGGGRE